MLTYNVFSDYFLSGAKYQLTVGVNVLATARDSTSDILTLYSCVTIANSYFCWITYEDEGVKEKNYI